MRPAGSRVSVFTAAFGMGGCPVLLASFPSTCWHFVVVFRPHTHTHMVPPSLYVRSLSLLQVSWRAPPG